MSRRGPRSARQLRLAAFGRGGATTLPAGVAPFPPPRQPKLPLHGDRAREHSTSSRVLLYARAGQLQAEQAQSFLDSELAVPQSRGDVLCPGEPEQPDRKIPQCRHGLGPGALAYP